MKLRGVVRSGELQENPPGSDRVELVLKLQGVGPTQPRTVVVPFETLVSDESLDPENVSGRGFDAEVIQDEHGRWMVDEISFASKVLRPPG